MRQTTYEIKTQDAVSLLTGAFTAATTDIISDTAHGLSFGAKVRLTTSDTLPAGLALLTDYYLVEVTANTFKLAINKPANSTDTYDVVDITDTGTGTQTWTVAGTSDAVLVEDYRHKELTVALEGMGASDSVTVKVKGSSREEMPDFGDVKSADNPWDYMGLVDQEAGDALAGDTGIVMADADDVKKLAINVDGIRWMAVEIAAQTDTGNTTVTTFLSLYND